MIAVIFEVEIKEGQLTEYLNIANSIRDDLLNIDGFISVERYQSLQDTGKYLSLSFWRDLESVEEWKRNKRHISAQEEGKQLLFNDYRICVCQTVRLKTMNEANEGRRDKCKTL